jgi:hypothetical protein
LELKMPVIAILLLVLSFNLNACSSLGSSPDDSVIPAPVATQTAGTDSPTSSSPAVGGLTKEKEGCLKAQTNPQGRGQLQACQNNGTIAPGPTE